ncbi:gamma-butyrobetaine dioxygenase-like [Corticium candelabrum]|uniref:gamma-butyrobetaine dioxygenase-like n=1 Tax=Corticium candelabrum TaxID=121492 RepID=UPI002E258686|nr:gamma-butyrobetaine dioxygenase-like [Corticium candelabrum]
MAVTASKLGLLKVKSKPDATTISYTGTDLPLHTDYTFCDYPNGIQFFHFIEQLPDPTEAVSRFCDGFNVAEALRKRNRAAFDMLSQYPIQFVDCGTDCLGDYDTESWHNMIKVSPSGEITAISYSSHTRGPHFSALLMDKLYEWYAAYYEFSHLLNSPDYVIEFNQNLDK